MATFKTTPNDYIKIKIRNRNVELIKKDIFDNFNETILGLGNIESKSNQKNALSVIFDLEGFTNFCKQIDPQLAVPEFLSNFLKWLFEQVRKTLINESFKEGYTTWSELPFLSKYLGDGILFLWDTENMDDEEILNVVAAMYEICINYPKTFLPSISNKIISPPSKLRCGIARGAIYSVGNGNDFVGPCINMSARLQKFGSLSFCFSRRGIDPNFMSDSYSKLLIVKKVNIRGIGSEELICILKREYDLLDENEKSNFKEV